MMKGALHKAKKILQERNVSKQKEPGATSKQDPPALFEPRKSSGDYSAAGRNDKLVSSEINIYHTTNRVFGRTENLERMDPLKKVSTYSEGKNGDKEDISAQELQEFLELEIQAKDMVSKSMPGWWTQQNSATNSKHKGMKPGVKEQLDHKEKRALVGTTPDMFKEQRLRETLKQARAEVRTSTGKPPALQSKPLDGDSSLNSAQLLGYRSYISLQKNNGSAKYITDTTPSVEEGIKRYTESFRRSMVAKSEKPSPLFKPKHFTPREESSEIHEKITSPTMHRKSSPNTSKYPPM